MSSQHSLPDELKVPDDLKKQSGLLSQPKAVWAVAFACVISFMGLVDPILPAIADQLHATKGRGHLLPHAGGSW
ncbi:putative aconitase with swiveling domain [Paenibacillus brasilensis]|uniref:Aconitase with swiveling domain n=1 Tax=Paenibacillus brasilensis TaxID=128574 RepID=A0ABU0L0T4_9BACL|nr:putative aconitase with swiveling domain [Paenibacillus brasilensis]